MEITPEESAFIRHGGFGLLSMFDQGVKRSAKSLERQFGGRVNEALKLNLIEEVRIENQPELYYAITPRGIKLRNN